MGQAVVNPNAINVPELARILTAALGQTISEEMIQAAVRAGAPFDNGTINLVKFLAWLEKEIAAK